MKAFCSNCHMTDNLNCYLQFLIIQRFVIVETVDSYFACDLYLTIWSYSTWCHFSSLNLFWPVFQGTIFLPGNNVTEHSTNGDESRKFLFEIVPGMKYFYYNPYEPVARLPKAISKRCKFTTFTRKCFWCISGCLN